MSDSQAMSKPFVRSRLGLAFSVLALGIGLVGLIFSVVWADIEAAMPFVFVVSLGAFLSVMQFIGVKR